MTGRTVPALERALSRAAVYDRNTGLDLARGRGLELRQRHLDPGSAQVAGDRRRPPPGLAPRKFDTFGLGYIMSTLLLCNSYKFRVGMNMASKMISVSVPEDMLPEIDGAARREHRSRSELIREAVRRYLTGDPGRILPVDEAQPEEIEAIGRGRAEFSRGEFIRLDDLQRELGIKAQ